MRKLFRTWLFWAATLALWELIISIQVTGLTWRYLGTLPFTLSLAAFLAVVSHMGKKPLTNRIVRFTLLGIIVFVFGVQHVYYRIFKTLLSLSYVEMGGEAIAGFTSVTLNGIWHSMPVIILMLLPVPALAVLQNKGIIDSGRTELEPGMLMFCASVLLFALGVPQKGSGTVRSSTYYNASVNLERQVGYFGLVTTERLEIQHLATGTSEDEGGAIIIDQPTQPGQDQGMSAEELTEKYNIMPDFDFQLLADSADTAQKRELSQYFASKQPREKNEYTGLFEGYNLIQICAESFYPFVVDKDLTPALYRLTHEGIVFDNFYCSFPGLTTNGEYAYCMGLMPDIRVQSFVMSMDNYVPFTMGNRFKALGIQGRAYHDFTATYYERINSHPNMGYDFKALGFGLELPENYPYSDCDMMKATVDDYIHDDRFMTYYMTFSGHMPYNFESNTLAVKNRDKVENLDVPDNLKAYIGGTLELEYAMEYLIDRLEQEGIADRTVIVMTGDHYPYSLNDESLRALVGDYMDEDPLWRYKNSFICWTEGLEETIHVDDYCCTQDVLPTLLNLFGFTYDSRLLTGTDVFSDGDHVALLQDGSFRNENMLYDSTTGKITWMRPESELPEGYGEQEIRYCENLITVAAAVLRTDYYEYAFTTCGIVDEVVKTEMNNSFFDLEDTWYRRSVQNLVRYGVARGASGEYNGDGAASRADMVVMLSRMLFLPEAGPERMPFTDIESVAWYAAPVKMAWEAGIVESAFTFRPLDEVTVEEARRMMAESARYLGILEPDRWADSVMGRVLREEAACGGSVMETGIVTRGVLAVLVDSFAPFVPELAQ